MRNGKKIILETMLILVLCASVYAEESAITESQKCGEIDANAAESKGFYLSLPAYLYGEDSVMGLKCGYQFKKLNFRLDVNFSQDYRDGEDVWFFMPAIGVFFSKELKSAVRIYEGVAVGLEKGMLNSFDGIVGFMYSLVGVEFLSLGNKTFFVEGGSGMSFKKKEGAFNTGTIIGCGIKYYF